MLHFPIQFSNHFLLLSWQGGAYTDSGKTWRAQDIALKERACAWMRHGFMSVDMTLGAGRAFLKSLYKQYAEWGVDFGNVAVTLDSFH